jgi:hypothetical protein
VHRRARSSVSSSSATTSVCPTPRVTVPVLADLAGDYPRLKLLDLEATATARVLGATVWLSEPSAAGVLPAVLDAERVPWKVVSIS